MQELVWAIKKLKRGKAPGPDGIPIELYKEMDEDQLRLLLNLLNTWWNGTPTPLELTQSQVILIFKKGDKNNLENYRPISLLNSTYKFLTAIIQKRHSDGLDEYLQTTQYGFRRKRGTAQALHYVRRAVEKGERTRTTTLFILLDWEKAFDKVLHWKIPEALRRMNVPDKLVNIIEELYRHPTFKIEMENNTSQWYTQETGIRQGCPLSPYLFTVIMTCLFPDIHYRDGLRTREHRIEGTTHDQVLYADDTICMSEDEAALQRLIQAIEVEGATYGLRLNNQNCEYLFFGRLSRYILWMALRCQTIRR